MSEMEKKPDQPNTSDTRPVEIVVKQPERLWSMLCHLTALVGIIIPFGNLIGPLVIWLIQKDKIPLVDAEGKESLNFQISMIIYSFVAALLIVIVIGFFLLIVLGIINVIFVIVASVKVYNGEKFRYPLTIRLIK